MKTAQSKAVRDGGAQEEACGLSTEVRAGSPREGRGTRENGFSHNLPLRSSPVSEAQLLGRGPPPRPRGTLGASAPRYRHRLQVDGVPGRDRWLLLIAIATTLLVRRAQALTGASLRHHALPWRSASRALRHPGQGVGRGSEGHRSEACRPGSGSPGTRISRTTAAVTGGAGWSMPCIFYTGSGAQ